MHAPSSGRTIHPHGISSADGSSRGVSSLAAQMSPNKSKLNCLRINSCAYSAEIYST